MTRSPMESIPPCWNTSAPSSGITLFFTVSISSIGSSSAGAVAPLRAPLASGDLERRALQPLRRLTPGQGRNGACRCCFLR
jgi:hypothetical protein